jgi:uncharacterized alkaline shock family protein YloU
MSEPATQETRGPLQSDRGTTVIADGVVAQLAGMAASEIEGVHMGGQASRSAGNVLSSVTGSSGSRRGISVEVGQIETAMDLTMGLTYGKNIVETTDAVRRNVRARVESLTGLKVTELNITINDIVFPEDAPPPGYGSVRDTGGESDRAADRAGERPRETESRQEPTRRERREAQERARSEAPTRDEPSRREPPRREPASDETAELNLPDDEEGNRGR